MLLCILRQLRTFSLPTNSFRLISNQAGLDEIKNSLGDDGRVLVRYSGTESKIRLLAEGRTQLLANHTLDSRLSLARTHLNLIDNQLSN